MTRLNLPWRLVKRIPQALRGPIDRLFGGPCAACGARAISGYKRVLSSELIAEWELSAEWVRHFELREGTRCATCGSSLRAQQMAGVVVEECASRFGLAADSLATLCDHPGFHALQVAEINSCAEMHQFLRRHPRLAYSEYGSKTVPSEDLQALSYADASFDLVLTGDTLEHVPDMRRALAEIARVMKPAGVHVFTVPRVMGRPTRIRAVLEHGSVRHLLPPSYHGPRGTRSNDRLVFIEAGDDLENLVGAAGWQVRAVHDRNNPALVTFITQPIAPRPA